VPDVYDVLERHVELFNAGVRRHDFSCMLSQFADEAVMRFEGVPVGPFEGRSAIAEAYRGQPPDDEIRVLDTSDGGPDRVIARYAWAAAPERMAGRLHLSARDGLITELVVTFESS
jgi:steroid Delta-isomerase